MDDSQVFDRYYNLTLRYLSYRPRSEKEILEYLKKKTKKLATTEPQNEAETQIETIIYKIIAKLKEYKFVDDREFAKFWVEQRVKFKHKPIRVIEFELKQKGIDREIIDEVLSKFEGGKSLDEQSAKKLAEKKLDFYRSLSPEKRREKVTNYLLRKGFSYETVKKVLAS